MSRDFTPCQLYNADIHFDGAFRNSTLTYKLTDSDEEIRVDNHLAKDRYPELSFLFEKTDALYQKYEHDEFALKTLDRIEAFVKEAEEDYGDLPFTSTEYETVNKWFNGKLDPDFYYHEENDALFEEFIEQTVQNDKAKNALLEIADKKDFVLISTDDSYTQNLGKNDIPRTNEAIYTYKLGEKGSPLYIDIYAAKNKNGDFIVYNMDSEYAYSPSSKAKTELPKELTKLLEKETLEQFKYDITPEEQRPHGTIVILAGASGSGKDTLRNALVENGYERLITSTTRAPREGEADGVDYHFKSVEDFEKGIADGSIFEYRKYESSDGVKYYGSEKQELDPRKDYVIVLDDTGVEDYQKAYGRDKVFAVLVEVPDEVRYQRAFDREFPERETFGEAWNGNKEPAPNGGHIVYESKEARIEKFELEWAKRLADDKNRFNPEFIGRAINYVANNEGSIDDVQAQLQVIQKMCYEAYDKDPNKHYVVKETYDKETGFIRSSLEEAKPEAVKKEKFKPFDDR